SSPNSAPGEIQERYQWTKVFGHRLTQLPKLLNRDKALSNVVLLQHREIRDLRQFGPCLYQKLSQSTASEVKRVGTVSCKTFSGRRDTWPSRCPRQSREAASKDILQAFHGPTATQESEGATGK